MEVYDVVIDGMEAKNYKAGKTLHLTKPNRTAAVAFIALTSIGAVFSIMKIIFNVVWFLHIIRRKKDDNESIEMASCTQSIQKKESELRLNFINIIIKASTLVFEDVAQAIMSYWFVTRCSVIFNSLLKISFICVCPLLNFAYFTFIIIQFAVKYRSKNKREFRCIAVALFLINVVPFVFGVLSCFVAFERTNLVGDVPEIVLVERATFANQTRFNETNQTTIVKKISLYKVWRILESSQTHPRNIRIPCKSNTFIDNKIFNGCTAVKFQFYYDQVEFSIVYKILSCKDSPESCEIVTLNQTSLTLEFSSNFCGEEKLKPK